MNRKKNDATVKKTAAVSDGAVPKTPARKADGRTVEGRLAKKKEEYETACRHLAEIKKEHERLFARVRTLEMLLASFNALTRKDDVPLVKPDKDTPYWYLFANPTVQRFDIIECSWKDWRSDHYRYVKGNMFLSYQTAVTACTALNTMLSEL